MRIAMLGAGAWGTALAMAAAARHDVVLWARDAAQAEAMSLGRENTRYLPGESVCNIGFFHACKCFSLYFLNGISKRFGLPFYA